MSQNILITGGTGLVGTRLTEMLLEKGYQVYHLSRSGDNKQTVKTYVWDVEKKEIDPEALASADYVIHLAGAGVADKRWTKSRKEVILKSRTESAQLLHDAIAQLGSHQIKAFIAASGINYYGEDTGSVEMIESRPKGNGFLADVTQQWEAAVDNIKKLNIRVVKFRMGVVLSKKGGALVKIVQPIKFGAGAPLGSGQQYMSWIHIDDVCRMYIYAIENEKIEGVYNAVAPHPVTNEQFTQSAAKVLHRPLFLPNIPAFAIRLVYGELASAVLGGSKVSNEKIKETGFKFKFENVDTALSDLLK